MSVIDFSELKEKVRGALMGMNWVSVDVNGLYFSECSKDYRDELDDSQVADVLAGRYRYRMDGKEHIDKMEPMAALNNLLMDAYQDEMWRLEDAVLAGLRSDENILSLLAESGLDDEQMHEFLVDALRDVWYASAPVDDYLKQDVCMDIMLDTGDCNYEFTRNNLLSSYIESSEDFDDNSSLLWLCEQQGITREELFAAFRNGSAHSNDVLALRERRDALVDALQQYGFNSPRFGERLWHTGSYMEWARLQDTVSATQKNLDALRGKYENNDMSYSEYLKKHFDKYQRLDPMTEEQFNIRKAEVLSGFTERIEKLEAQLAVAQERLDANPDYGQIAKCQAELMDVRRKLTEMSGTEEYEKAEFIDSVYNEVLNMSSGSGVVTFLVKMPLDEAIRLREVVDGEASMNNSYYYENRSGRSSIVLDKNVRCGLMDDAGGGGSVFEIKLLEDVEIPVKALYRAVPDRENGNYGFQEIYGMDDLSFERALKEIKPQLGDVVMDVIASAQERSGEANTRESSMELGLD